MDGSFAHSAQSNFFSMVDKKKFEMNSRIENSFPSEKLNKMRKIILTNWPSVIGMWNSIYIHGGEIPRGEVGLWNFNSLEEIVKTHPKGSDGKLCMMMRCGSYNEDLLIHKENFRKIISIAKYTKKLSISFPCGDYGAYVYPDGLDEIEVLLRQDLDVLHLGNIRWTGEYESGRLNIHKVYRGKTNFFKNFCEALSESKIRQINICDSYPDPDELSLLTKAIISRNNILKDLIISVLDKTKKSPQFLELVKAVEDCGGLVLDDCKHSDEQKQKFSQESLFVLSVGSYGMWRGFREKFYQ